MSNLHFDRNCIASESLAES